MPVLAVAAASATSLLSGVSVLSTKALSKTSLSIRLALRYLQVLVHVRGGVIALLKINVVLAQEGLTLVDVLCQFVRSVYHPTLSTSMLVRQHLKYLGIAGIFLLEGCVLRVEGDDVCGVRHILMAWPTAAEGDFVGVLAEAKNCLPTDVLVH